MAVSLHNEKKRKTSESIYYFNQCPTREIKVLVNKNNTQSAWSAFQHNPHGLRFSMTAGKDTSEQDRKDGKS